MSVIIDSIALRYVHRLDRLRLEKASWGSLLEETTEKMQRRMTLTMLPGLRGHDGYEGARNYELLEGKTQPGRGSVSRFAQSFL